MIVRETVVPEAPAELTRCAGEPFVPPEGADGYDVADFIVALGMAGRDCRATLGELSAWLAAARARSTEGSTAP